MLTIGVIALAIVVSIFLAIGLLMTFNTEG